MFINTANAETLLKTLESAARDFSKATGRLNDEKIKFANLMLEQDKADADEIYQRRELIQDLEFDARHAKHEFDSARDGLVTLISGFKL